MKIEHMSASAKNYLEAIYSLTQYNGEARNAAVATRLGVARASVSRASAALIASIAAIFSPLAALSFMAFNLLSVPCMAAVSAMRGEMRSAKWTWFTIAFWIVTAWIVSFLIFNVGTLLGF